MVLIKTNMNTYINSELIEELSIKFIENIFKYKSFNTYIDNGYVVQMRDVNGNVLFLGVFDTREEAEDYLDVFVHKINTKDFTI